LGADPLDLEDCLYLDRVLSEEKILLREPWDVGDMLAGLFSPEP